jgi:hypothetical protein
LRFIGFEKSIFHVFKVRYGKVKVGFQVSKFQGVDVSINRGFVVFGNQCYKVQSYKVLRNQIFEI